MTPGKRFPMPRDLTERWLLRVEKEGHDGCWRWIGATWEKGYGKFTLPETQRRIGAHVWGYERFIGPVPDGMELDHTCHDPQVCRDASRCPHRSCVNPAHLEPVPHGENVRRGLAPHVNGAHNAAITHCPRGHEYTPENTYYRKSRPGRNCRACGAIVTKRRKAEARARGRQEEAA